MVLLNKSVFAAALLSSHISFVAAENYWLDPKCAEFGDFNDAITEAIWVADRAFTAIVLRDTVTLDANSFKWFFGLSPTPEDATDVYPYSEEYSALVGDTFYRIGTLTQTDTRLSARLRIYCDNDDRYIPVDGEGDTVSLPDVTTEDGQAAFRRTRFWDRDNDSVVFGSSLDCRLPNALGKTAYAHGVPNIGAITEKYGKAFVTSSQASDRFTISICNSMLNQKNGQGNAAKFWTLRALAERKLENLSGLYALAPNAAETMIHEFVHVPFLSSQTVTIDGSASGFEHGTDSHNGEKHNGYYRGSQSVKPNFLSSSLTFKNLLMNPDSYSYVASILRLRDKQWEAYVSDEATHLVLFRKNLNLVAVGDWPGATALARRALRFLRKAY